MISTNTGASYEAKSLRALLTVMLDDIMSNVLLFDETIATVLPLITAGKASVTASAQTSATQMIHRALHAANIEISQTPPISRTSTSSDRASAYDDGAIAVIGMVARLPGSETLAEFWHILEKGKDMMREV